MFLIDFNKNAKMSQAEAVSFSQLPSEPFVFVSVRLENCWNGSSTMYSSRARKFAG